MTGQALAMKMKLELNSLARRHRTASGISCALPLAAPSNRSVLITGIASSPTIDQERTKFRPYALNFLPWKLPPLLFRHKEPAGLIENLAYDRQGRLIIDARVDHPEARRCGGLSVAATIERYELREIDDPENYHAVILQASLDEVSLTPTPANPDCLITSRLPANPHNEFFDLAQQGVKKCIEFVEVLERFTAQSSPPPPPRSSPQLQCSAPRIYGPVPSRPSRPRTEFGKLADALSSRMEA